MSNNNFIPKIYTIKHCSVNECKYPILKDDKCVYHLNNSKQRLDIPTGKKTCTRCLEEKPYSEFYVRRNRRNGRQSICISCESIRRASPIFQYKDEWYERNREDNLAKSRDKAYGLKKGQYADMLVEQDYKCAICGQEETALNKRGVVRQLAVDHDHSTGAIRGLLCQMCNMALGGMRDDIEIMQNAIEYLTKHKGDK